MRLYVLVPLAVSALCLLYVWIANRRARVGGAVIPQGMLLSGDVESPDLQYDGDVVLGGTHAFQSIRCRRLRIARGADVSVRAVEAGRVSVEGRLRNVKILTAAKLLEVRGGELRVDDVRAPKIVIDKNASAVVLTVTGTTRLVRHPAAEVKGFFADLDEAVGVGAMTRLNAYLPAAVTTSSDVRH
jgi:cytoskeletal protein CcmA (bactofilin family)